MHSIRSERCFHHPEREAVARCPECGKFYCRECITEHDFRVLCATCLKTRSINATERGFSIGTVFFRTILFLLSLAALWVLFYGAGKALSAMPSVSFHDEALSNTELWMEQDSVQNPDEKR